MLAIGRGAAVAGACLISIVGASCGADEEPVPARAPARVDLVVGDSIRLTGPAAGLGASAQKAAQLAVETANDAIRDAGVDQTLEIVHDDVADGGPARSAERLVKQGAGCIVGPRTEGGMRTIAVAPGVPERALLISPRAAGGLPSFVVALPPAGPQRTLGSEPGPGGRGPTASFAQLYSSTDPPIGPPRTSDARQFDSVLLCYLAAVAARSTKPERMRETLGQPGPQGRLFDWTELADAVRALGRRRPIEYAGLTLNVGVRPAPRRGGRAG